MLVLVINETALGNDVSMFQMPGERKFASRGPMVSNCHADRPSGGASTPPQRAASTVAANNC